MPQPNSSTTSTPRRSYDPGSPARIISHGQGRFTVQSWRDASQWYEVQLHPTDAQADGCACPDHAHRNRPDGCKHVLQARAQVFALTLDAARRHTLAEVRIALTRTRRPEVRDALRTALAQAEARFVPVTDPDDDCWAEAA